MIVSIAPEENKEEVVARIEAQLKTNGFTVVKKDTTRPWGAFLVLAEDQAQQFGKLYFPHLSFDEIKKGRKLSPKILLVAPHQRLSWQYHHRRAEIWKLVAGEAGVVSSLTDEEKEHIKLDVGGTIVLSQGQRHRLVGLDNWGVIAEIWQHTDPDHPSDEEDIVRVQDDFGR